MSTALLLTVSQHALGWWGVVCPGGCLPRGELSSRGGACPEANTPPPLWTEWQTFVKTWPLQTSFAGGKKIRKVDGFAIQGNTTMAYPSKNRKKKKRMNDCIWRHLSVLPSHYDASFVLFVGFVFTIDLPVTNPCFLQTLIVLLITVLVPYNTPQLALQTNKQTKKQTNTWNKQTKQASKETNKITIQRVGSLPHTRS